MTEHECLHEVDLNQITNDIAAIKRSQERLEKRFLRIDGTVFGNGSEGHTVKLARYGDAIKRQWWALGIVIVGLAGLAIRSLV